MLSSASMRSYQGQRALIGIFEDDLTPTAEGRKYNRLRKLCLAGTWEPRAPVSWSQCGLQGDRGGSQIASDK